MDLLLLDILAARGTCLLLGRRRKQVLEPVALRLSLCLALRRRHVTRVGPALVF